MPLVFLLFSQMGEYSELNKEGAQFGLEFAKELLGMVKEDSPEELKELVRKVIQVKRVSR